MNLQWRNLEVLGHTQSWLEHHICLRIHCNLFEGKKTAMDVCCCLKGLLRWWWRMHILEVQFNSIRLSMEWGNDPLIYVFNETVVREKFLNHQAYFNINFLDKLVIGVWQNPSESGSILCVISPLTSCLLPQYFTLKPFSVWSNT